MIENKPILIVVVGPTAVGKTDTCVAIAQHLHSPVVSADSRQFYREMQLGTAKPTIEEMQGVPHYFINNLSVTQHYSVGDYEREALAQLKFLFSQHPIAILTGGSGLFIKAVCEGIDDMPSLVEGIREQLMEEFAQAGLAPLLAELQAKDPHYAQTVDQANHARVIRALEVIRSTGLPFSQFRQSEPKLRDFQILKIGLERNRTELYERINQRVDQMIANGLLEEVKKLLPYQSNNALQTVGYQELFDYFNGNSSLEESIELIKRNSRRYAKRQLTWFRRDKGIKWFHSDKKESILQYIAQNYSV